MNQNNKNRSGEATADGFPAAARWLSEGFEELLREDSARLEEQKLEVVFDIVIVGSGYGGALAAAELAGGVDAVTKKPARICVLERGREYLAGMFPGSEADLPGALKVNARSSPDPYGAPDGVVDLRMGKDVSVLLANGLGGGSLINAGVMEEAKPWVFQEPCWPEELRREGALADWYKAAREMLAPNVNGGFNKVRTSLKQQAFLRLYPEDKAVRRRLELEPPKQIDSYIATANGKNSADVDLQECKRCGDCMTGCNQRAKNSLDQNALVKASRRNARIICGANVMRLEREHTKAGEACWDLYILHTDPLLRRRQDAPFRLRARRVVLAAGSLGTTEILLRSQAYSGSRLRERLRPHMPKLWFSSQLGERFSSNGDLIAASYDEKLEVNAVAKETQEFEKRQVGPTTTVMLRAGSGEQQIVIQEFAIPGPIRRLFSEGFTTSHLFHRLANGERDFFHRPGRPAIDPYAVNPAVIAKTQSLGVMGHDGAGGRMVLRRRRNRDKNYDVSHLPLHKDGIEIRWRKLKEAGGLFDTHMKTLGKLITSSRVGGTLLSNPFWQLLPEKLTSVLDLKRGPALTTHPLGGCAMADTYHNGVVDQYGRVFDTRSDSSYHEGLVVLDGSFIPRSLGINPAFTISALVMRALAQLCTEWQSGKSSEAPRDIPPMPSFKAPRPALDISTQIAIHERMVGDLHLTTDPKNENKFTAEVTLQFEPASATWLATSMSRSLKVVEKESFIRIFRREELREMRASGDSEFSCHQRAVFSANVRGSIRLLDRARTIRPFRVLRAMYAWYRNRGKRDAWNSLVSFISGSKRGVRELIPPGFCSVASHAGEIRLFEYDLVVGKEVEKTPVPHRDRWTIAEGSKIEGKKRITYAYGANPWTQLSEMQLTRFPRLHGRKKTILELEPKHFAREQKHLFEIVRERDGVTGMMELFSFLLYTMRLVAGIHLWSFRKPDTPPVSRGNRLPGDVPGMRSPQVTTIDMRAFDHKTNKRGGRAQVRLARYRRDGATQPVLLIHGFSASGTTFAHPALNPGLAKFLHDAGRDVWVVDLRTSSGMRTSKSPWTFEQIALRDIPKAIYHILRETGVKKIDVVAHCMGAAMFSMSLLKPGSNRVAPYIRNVVLSQVGPMVVFTPANVFRAYCVRYIQQIFRNSNFEFRPKKGGSNDFLDRLLATVPYPREEFAFENPGQPCARTPFTTTRHRMDAWFGRVFNIANMEPEVLDHIDDFFGAINLRTSFQTIHFARYGLVTNTHGTNKFVLPDHMERLKSIRTFSIHGAKNGLADPATLTRMKIAMEEARVPFKSWEVPGFGHQDCMMGRDAGTVVFPELLKFLNEGPEVRIPKTWELCSVHIPYMGPLVGMPDASGKVFFAIASDPRFKSPKFAISIAAKQVDDAWRQKTLDDLRTGHLVWRRHELHEAEKGDPPHWFQIPEDLTEQTTPAAFVVFFLYDQASIKDREFPALGSFMFRSKPGNAVHQAPGGSTNQSLEHLLETTLINDLKQAHVQFSSPQTEGAAQLKFAVASCQYPAGPLDPRLATSSYARLGGLVKDEATSPRCVLLLGDQIYTDATAGAFDPTQLDDRYRLPYQEWLRTGEIRDVLRRLPLFAMPDDHEIENNWEPDLHPREKLWDRFVKGRKEYFRVLRATDPNYLSPGHYRGPAWYPTKIDGFDFFFCDARTERKKRDAVNVATAEIMGEHQARALKAWLDGTATDRPRFVSSGSILLPRRKLTTYRPAGAINSDAWDGYPASLQGLLAYIANRRLKNLVFLSGDEHHSCIATVSLRALDEECREIEDLAVLHSIHSSALNAPFPFANGEPADLAAEESFWFSNPELSTDYPHPKIGVTVTTQFVSQRGDGFAVLDCTRSTAGWSISCAFSRPDDSECYRIDAKQCVRVGCPKLAPQDPHL